MRWNLKEAVSKSLVRRTEIAYKARLREISWHKARERHPDIQSCREFDRKLLEAYLTYLRTEETTTRHYHAELTRLRGILESIGRVLEYRNLEGLFLNRDIPPTPKAEFKTYSDAELKRLNAAITKMDEQVARAMPKSTEFCGRCFLGRSD